MYVNLKSCSKYSPYENILSTGQSTLNNWV